MRLGIRLQILLLLGALLAVGFIPLYVAVARLTEASLASARREYARGLGRAVASHVLEAKRSRPDEALDALLDAQLSDTGVTAIAIYDKSGSPTTIAGDASLLPASLPRPIEEARRVDSAHGRSLFVVVPAERGGGAVALTLTLSAPTAGSSALVQLVALYTGVVALALLVFAYFAMTRLVVRPVEQVSRAAGRVAAGARNLDLERPAARELAELADSLREMTDKLIAEEQALRSKVEELQRAKRDLESAQESMVRSERLASVGRLAAGVAHEIGNPIAAILGFEELLLGGDLSPEERNDFLVRMKGETERVNRVLRDLLDFARPGAPPSGKERPRANVREASDLVAALLKPQKRLSNLTLHVEIADALPEAAIAGERLQQVLLNLLLNAIDAAKSVIELRAEPTSEHVVITVADDGPGIAPEIRDRLFEPFATTKDVGKGTGLGLAVCRGLVEATGGTITVGETTLGGASFVIRIPIADQREASRG
ncbi:MAG: HAMP domain-containing histidine kinase [Polyangiaceae bacterium]|nr:HAMP domain-containing histidine kinase [Polyangiaceae bacterium]